MELLAIKGRKRSVLMIQAKTSLSLYLSVCVCVSMKAKFERAFAHIMYLFVSLNNYGMGLRATESSIVLQNVLFESWILFMIKQRAQSSFEYSIDSNSWVFNRKQSYKWTFFSRRPFISPFALMKSNTLERLSQSIIKSAHTPKSKEEEVEE